VTTKKLPKNSERHLRKAGMTNPRHIVSSTLLLFVVLVFVVLVPATPSYGEDTNNKILLTPVHEIDDHEAKVLLARSLSYSKETWGEAIHVYESLIQDPHADTELVKEYLTLLESSGEHQKIIDFIDSGTIHERNKSASLYAERKLLALIALGEITAALEYILTNKDSLQIENKDLLLARLYSWAEIHSESISLYAEVIKRESQLPLKELTDAGSYLLAQKEYELSRQYYAQALLSEENNPEAMRGLALLNYYSNEYEAAYTYFEKIEKELSDREVYIAFLRTLARIHEYDNLLNYLHLLHTEEIQRSVDPAVYFDISLVYAEIGDPHNSNYFWEQYKSFFHVENKIPLTHHLQYIDVLKSFGDLYKAEELLHELSEYFNSDADKVKIRTSLAHLLVSTERYEEANLLVNLNTDFTHESIMQLLKSHDLRWNFELEKEAEHLDVMDNQFASNDPRTIKNKSDFLLTQGRFEESIQLLEELSEKYVDFFPARLALSFSLASSEEYKKSLMLFDEMLEKHPEHRMLLLGKARVLSWHREYDDAVAAYKKILEMHPCDPIVKRELARVHTWDKNDKKALSEYLVDEECRFSTRFGNFLLDLVTVNNEMSAQIAQIYLTYQNKEDENKRDPFHAYENTDLALLEDTIQHNAMYQDRQKEFAALKTEYRIQKANWLEREAKKRKLHNRNFQAIEKYDELISFMPWNQEAHFDLAQLQCLTNQPHHAKESYENLLNIDPSHTFARNLIEHKRNTTPLILENTLRYYSEIGRGELSRVHFTENKAGLTLPVDDMLEARLSADLYRERPGFNRQTLFARGFTAGVNLRMDPKLTIFTEYSYKDYEQDFDTVHTGGAGFEYDFNDYAQLELAYNRTNEFYNFFAIDQSVQADRYSAKLSSFFTRRWIGMLRHEYLEYSDANRATQSDIATAYIFNEHPKTFKVTLAGQHRHTENDNQFIFNGSELSDLVHPYWAPRNYYLGTITFEWLHDISKHYFCGSDTNFYNVKLILGDDTDRNRLIRLEGLWEYDLYENYTLGIQGMIHRSRDWDSESLLGNIKYRF
jgi:hypothetical protein